MTGVLSRLIEELGSGELRVVDLTRSLGPDTPVIGLPPPFAQSPGASIEAISRYDEQGPAWYWNELRLGEHTGTHFDAPIHWITGKDLPGNACDTIPAAQFVGPACVMNVEPLVESDPDFLLRPEHITDWETEHGRIPAGAWLLLRTAWSARKDPGEFLNVDDTGPHSPGFRPDAVELLAYERDVLGLGVETVGTDAGQAADLEPAFPAHSIMHGAGKFGLASLCNLDKLPPTGAVVIAAPLKVVGGSGSPVRAIAITPT
jgi:kynurenine formamidase